MNVNLLYFAMILEWKKGFFDICCKFYREKFHRDVEKELN